MGDVVFVVVGSPWRIDIRNPARVTVNSSGLHQMSVGKVAIFELNSTDPDSDITVNVTRMYLSLQFSSILNTVFLQKNAEIPKNTRNAYKIYEM